MTDLVVKMEKSASIEMSAGSQVVLTGIGTWSFVPPTPRYVAGAGPQNIGSPNSLVGPYADALTIYVEAHSSDVNVTVRTGQDEEQDTVRVSSLALARDVNMMSVQRNSPLSRITMPTPYVGTGLEVLHPSLVFVPGGVSGYRWWIVYTPYPGANSEFENPVIAASNDLKNWVQPIGLPSPVLDSPVGTAFNRDVNLSLHPDGRTLILVVCQRGVAATNRVLILTSQDGINWSDPSLIWSGAVGVTDFGSPSLWYDDAQNEWVMVGHQLDASAPWPLVRTTSKMLKSGWSQSLTTLTFPPPPGRSWWHSCFKRLSSGRIIGIVQDNSGIPGVSGNLYAAQSDNGTSFYSTPLELTGGLYRASFEALVDDAGQESIALVYSRLNAGFLEFAFGDFNKPAYSGQYQAMIGGLLNLAAVAPIQILWGDTFNRPDDATGLGTATSGGTYTQVSADRIGISSNRAYNTNSNNCRAHADLGRPNFSAALAVHTPGSQFYLMFRFTDNNNYWRLGVTSIGGTLALQRIGGGAVQSTQQVGPVVVAGDVIAVNCVQNSIEIVYNGAIVATALDTFNSSATRVGIQASGAVTSFLDSLVAWRI